MRTHELALHRWARVFGAGVALLGLMAGSVRAIPTVDGTRDAEYTLVTSPNAAQDVAGNLLKVADPANPGSYIINDETNPTTKNLDVVKMYAANSATTLYIYIELPNLNLQTVFGDWSVVMHLGGANDALQVAPLSTDPYANSIFFGYSTAGQMEPNAVIKSNFRSGAASSQDGMNGYSDLVLVNSTQGWNYGDNAGTRNLFGTFDQTPVPAGTTLVSGIGTTGAKIVYKEGAGIELSVPFSAFGQNPDSQVTAPKIGDPIQMQFVATTRRGGFTNPGDHLRGAIDSYPYDPSARQDPSATDPNDPGTYTRGLAKVYGSYTLSQPTAFELTNVEFKDRTHLTLTFSDPVGNGATTATNYTATDLTTNAPITVSAAETDLSADNKITLTTGQLPAGRKVKVTVSNVQNTGGQTISATKNTLEAQMPTLVVFKLTDYGNVAAGRQVTVTGSFNNWANSGTGEGEIALNPVAGQQYTYESAPVYVPAGPIQYKYRIPSDPQAWTVLNPDNRTSTVPVQEATFTISDIVLQPVPVTFNLYDPDNLAAGNPVTVTGEFTGWASDTTNEIPMNPVAGQPNHYQSAPVNIVPNVQKGYIEYKYRIPSLGGNTAWDTLNFAGDPNRRIAVPAGAPSVSTNDIVPTSVPVDMTFKLVDAENRANGKPIYLVGRFNSWTPDPLTAPKLEPVAGEANTYQVTTPMDQGYTTYKYVTIVDDPANPGSFIVDWNLFGQNDRFTNIIGTGSPLAQTVTDVVGTVTPPAVRALRIAGGLEAAPANISALDKNGNGQVDLIDAIRLLTNR